jgi:hypothetical protein
VFFAQSLVFLCGDQKIDWTCLEALFEPFWQTEHLKTKWFQETFEGQTNPAHALIRKKGLNEIDEDSWYSAYFLDSLLDLSVSTEAFDPRDKLYALLSLIEWPQASTFTISGHDASPMITADYTKSSTEVFITAMDAISRDGVVSVVSAPQIFEKLMTILEPEPEEPRVREIIDEAKAAKAAKIG